VKTETAKFLEVLVGHVDGLLTFSVEFSLILLDKAMKRESEESQEFLKTLF